MIEISVLIPTYLRPRMLRRAIESCLVQEEIAVAFEVVVVDNDPLGNTDIRVHVKVTVKGGEISVA